MTSNKLFAGGSVVALLLLIYGAFITMGGVINTSSGIPPGFYLKVDKPLAVGKTVMFCPPNKAEFQDALKRDLISAGSCPDGFNNMMLKIAAMSGAKITINENGVYVDNILQPESKPKQQGEDGQPMPLMLIDNYELKDGEILLLSDSNGDAFDGRYFGQIHSEQVDSVISPVF
jgi:conjugative transfer signal peptidase TraF